MCFSPFWVVSLLLLVVPSVLGARNRKAGVRAGLVSAAIFTAILLWVFLPGAVFRVRANRGDAEAMYDLARWTENHDQLLGVFIPWPVTPDVLGGYEWLEKSAAQGYPLAVYAVGVRLKHGEHVPKPADWDGAAGNYFPQPERGQPLIDQAIRLGYVPTCEEDRFYWKQYRSWR